MAKTVKTKKSSSSPPSNFWYDEAAAERAVRFFSLFLRHVKGESAGSSFLLQPWQEHEVIRPLFGWKRSDGTRKYRRVYVEIPRKNGKSTVAAGIGLYLLFADNEPGAEIYSAATDREQAAIVFDVARSMVEGEAQLKNMARVYRRAIAVPRTNSSYKVLSADAYTHHGLNAHGIIFDELHAQPNRELWDVLTTSTGARRQPVIFAITTAGYDKNSICYEVHDYALKVRDGIIDDPSFLPAVYAADKEDDWRLPEVWRKANPSLGITISEEYLAEECKRAQESPAYQNTFRQLHLNQWTEQSVRWLDMFVWDEGSETFDVDELAGRACFGGLDLSTTTDLSCFCLMFPPKTDGEKWKVLCWFWVPEENLLKRVERDRVPYDVWAREGYIELTPGNVIDYEFIRAKIRDLSETYYITELGYDPWNATGLVTELMNDGAELVPVQQSYARLNAPVKELERLIVSRELLHGGNPVLRWNASNASVKFDPSGNMKVDKSASTDRIDGIVAMLCALFSAQRHEGDGSSKYETEELLVI